MSPPRKRTDAETWRALEGDAADAGDAELARIGALDDDALDAELRAAGVDPERAAPDGS